MWTSPPYYEIKKKKTLCTFCKCNVLLHLHSFFALKPIIVFTNVKGDTEGDTHIENFGLFQQKPLKWQPSYFSESDDPLVEIVAWNHRDAGSFSEQSSALLRDMRHFNHKLAIIAVDMLWFPNLLRPLHWRILRRSRVTLIRFRRGTRIG